MDSADIPPQARDAAYAARYGEPVDTYTWNRVADKVLEAAASHLEAAERAKVQHAIDRVARTAAAAQEKAVAVAVAAERERLLNGPVTRIEPDPEQPGYNRGVFDIPAAIAQAVAAERERCAQFAEEEAGQRGSIVAEDALRQFAARLRDGQPPPAKRGEIAERAEEIHAEHHSGYIVPSLDSCPEHTRAEYEQLVADLLREAQP